MLYEVIFKVIGSPLRLIRFPETFSDCDMTTQSLGISCIAHTAHHFYLRQKHNRAHASHIPLSALPPRCNNACLVYNEAAGN